MVSYLLYDGQKNILFLIGKNSMNLPQNQISSKFAVGDFTENPNIDFPVIKFYYIKEQKPSTTTRAKGLTKKKSSTKIEI